MQSLNTFLCITLFSIVLLAKPIKVLMIDAGTPKYTNYYGKSVGINLMPEIEQWDAHAEAIFKGIMSGNCNKIECLKSACDELIVNWCIFYKRNDIKETDRRYFKCLDVAIKEKPDIINMSLTTPFFDAREQNLLSEIGKHSKIVAAAGNNSAEILDYPAAFSVKNHAIIPISALDEQGKLLESSNKTDFSVDFLGTMFYYDKELKYWLPMSGTSIAAALYTNKLINEMCKKGE